MIKKTLLTSTLALAFCGAAFAQSADSSRSLTPAEAVAMMATGGNLTSHDPGKVEIEHYALKGADQPVEHFVGDHERLILELQGKYARQAGAVTSIQDAASSVLAGLTPRHEISETERRQLLGLGMPKMTASKVDLDQADRSMALPSFKDLREGAPEDIAPRNTFLKQWQLTRTRDGGYAVMRQGDATTTIPAYDGAVLGEFGRVKTIVDDGAEFFILLDSGDQISGA